MKKLTLILFFLFSKFTLCLCQTTFVIDNISKDYYGKLFIADTSEVFSKGWIAIYEKKSKKQLIKVNSDELTFELHQGKVLANIKELPYGEQSQILYDDYNFDGLKDFAIMDGQNSCYHGPSFQIYLATSQGFKHSPAFTRLAQEYCGMFDVDDDTKTISTMTKSGCCWHQYNEFIVENNQPKVIKITENDDTHSPLSTVTQETWDGTKMVKSTRTTVDLEAEEVKTILSFHIDKTGKDVVLFSINDTFLNYAVLKKDGSVEFSYPADPLSQEPDFTFNRTENTLTFKNKNAFYQLYSNREKVGIDVQIEGKEYHWIGNNVTKKGNFKPLSVNKFDNVK